MIRAWHWMRGAAITLGRWTAANAVGVIFTAALLTASVGFGLAWLPLAFIFPGVFVVGLLVAWRWRMTLPPSHPVEKPSGGEVSD